jgi:pimeloyl-ACP methyl ester carboxylesterase
MADMIDEYGYKIKPEMVFLVPGRWEGLDGVMGRIISSLGFAVKGRAITPEFLSLWFSEQLNMVEADLRSGFWDVHAALVGHSYGAYILLHALAAMPSFPGRVLLISPVLGPGVTESKNYCVMPPRADRLLETARKGEFPNPGYLEIHTGAMDRGCDPPMAQEFASCIGNVRLYIVPDVGHKLPEDYILGVMREFLDVDTRHNLAVF